jgi:flagellin FlaB
MFEFINNEDDRGQVGIGTLIVFIAMVLVAAIAAGVLINTAGFLQTQAEETGQDSTDQVANNINVIGTVGDVGDKDYTGKVIQNPSGSASVVDYNSFSPYSDEGDDERIHTIKLTVQKSPGAGDIDLSELSIQYVAPNSFANLVHVRDAAPADLDTDVTDELAGTGEEAYFVSPITASSEDTVITKQSDRYQIIIPLQTAYDDDGSDVDGDNVDSNDLGRKISAEVTSEPAEASNTGYDNSALSLLDESASVELTITTASGSQRYVSLRVPDSLVGDGSGTVQL